MTIFLTILFTVLKVLGIILGSVLALLLTMILLVLFVPFRYQLDAQNEEKLSARFQVTWLLHLVRFRFRYIDNEMDYGLWVLFFEIPVNEEKKEKKPKRVKAKKTDKVVQDSAIQEKAAQEQATQEKITQEKTTKEKSTKEPLADKITRMFNNVKGKIKEITTTIEKVQKLVDDKYNQRAFEHLKKVVIWLLLRMKPRKMKLTLAFSAGSPDKTGQILGGLSIFPMAYRNRWDITPDFVTEESYYKGNCVIKGRIFVFWFAIAAVRVVTNKYCRRLYKRIRRTFKV